MYTLVLMAVLSSGNGAANWTDGNVCAAYSCAGYNFSAYDCYGCAWFQPFGGYACYDFGCSVATCADFAQCSDFGFSGCNGVNGFGCACNFAFNNRPRVNPPAAPPTPPPSPPVQDRCGAPPPAAAPPPPPPIKPAAPAAPPVNGATPPPFAPSPIAPAAAFAPRMPPPPIDSPTRIVEISGPTFQPLRVAVMQGETVRWINTSGMPHTVTADPRLARDPRSAALPPGAAAFNSAEIPPGGTYAHTFVVPGLYRYFCIPHESAGMIGEIEVLPR